jgi:hypothetical protein
MSAPTAGILLYGIDTKPKDAFTETSIGRAAAMASDRD